MRASNLHFIWLTAALLTACAVKPDPVVVSGEALVAAADVFVLTAKMMDDLHTQGTITDDQYKEWAVFGRRFQALYPAVVEAWSVARTHGDPALEQAMLEHASNLVFELYTWSTKSWK